MTEILEEVKVKPGDVMMERAVKNMVSLSNDEELISAYEREQIEEYATRVGEYQTKKKAREEGLEKGRQEGIKEGIKKGTFSIAKNLKQLGISIDDIVKATNLTKEDIEKL